MLLVLFAIGLVCSFLVPHPHVSVLVVVHSTFHSLSLAFSFILCLYISCLSLSSIQLTPRMIAGCRSFIIVSLFLSTGRSRVLSHILLLSHLCFCHPQLSVSFDAHSHHHMHSLSHPAHSLLTILFLLSSYFHSQPFKPSKPRRLSQLPSRLWLWPS